MRAKIIGALAIVAILAIVGCALRVPVAITIPRPPAIDLRAFTGIYFPGFMIDHAEFNAEIVRQLQYRFRTRGFTVVQGELSQWAYGQRFPTENFRGQTALVITGELHVAPMTQEGPRTTVSEQFDPYGRRQTTETRRWTREEGWVLTGTLALFQRERLFLRIPVTAVAKQPPAWGRISVSDATYTFCEAELMPWLLAQVAPRIILGSRWLLR